MNNELKIMLVTPCLCFLLVALGLNDFNITNWKPEIKVITYLVSFSLTTISTSLEKLKNKQNENNN